MIKVSKIISIAFALAKLLIRIIKSKGKDISLYELCELLFDPYEGTAFTHHDGAFDSMTPGKDLSHILSKEEAIADIDFILKTMQERHPACYKEIPDVVIKQSNLEKDNFTEQVTVLQLWQASRRMMATLKDGHSFTDFLPKVYYYLPLQFKYKYEIQPPLHPSEGGEKGKLYCTKGDFVGSSVVSIGGKSIEELLALYKSMHSFELDCFTIAEFADCCVNKEVLQLLNLDVNNSVEIVFSTQQGEITKICEFKSYEQSKTESNDKFVSYKTDKEKGVGLLTLTQCICNDVYKKTLKEFFTEVKTQQIQNVIVDLRENSGGTTGVIDEFFRYLDCGAYSCFGETDIRFRSVMVKCAWEDNTRKKIKDLLFHGNLYVLTSSFTFSSASDFATTVSDYKLGKVVCEITGQMPASYGDCLSFTTPND
jgi:hypothetical protein